MSCLKQNVETVLLGLILIFFLTVSSRPIQADDPAPPAASPPTKPSEPPKPASPAASPPTKPAEPPKQPPKDVYVPSLRIVPDRALQSGDKDLIREAVFDNISSKPPVAPKKSRQLLIFDLNVDFEGHRSIVCANYAFQTLAERTKAFKVVIAHEASAFEEDNLKQFDAVVFNNTVGNVLPDKKHRRNLEQFIRNGGGLLALHAATEAFVHYGGEQIGKDDWPLFGEMIGARGTKRRETDELVYIKIEDPGHPLTQAFPKDGFFFRDEILRFEDPYSRRNQRILLSLDNTKSALRRPPFGDRKERADEDYAVAWVKGFDRGRCCYIGLGHNPRTFWDPAMLQFHFAAIQFVLGDLDASVIPSASPPKPPSTSDKQPTSRPPTPPPAPIPQKPVETSKPV